MAWAIVGIHNQLLRNNTLLSKQNCREILDNAITYARVITDAPLT